MCSLSFIVNYEITFKELSTEEDGRAIAFYEYSDRTSCRDFRVRKLCGPVVEEIAAGVYVPEDMIRYFAHELIPTGRLVKVQFDEVVDLIDPDKKWAEIRNTPSKALMAIFRHTRKCNGFKPVIDEAEYNERMITYRSLEECALAIENAIDADVWLCSHEPIRRHILAPRTEIDFRSKALLASSPVGEKVIKRILELSKHLSEFEKLTVSYVWQPFMYVEDERLAHPVSVRLLVFFDDDGRLASRGFTRGCWRQVMRTHFGVKLEDFDGPAGFTNGRKPLFGQVITHPGVRPASVTACELVHNEFVDTNKLFGRVEIDGATYFIRGKIIAGEFTVQKLPPKEDGAVYVLGRLRRGALPIGPEEIPHFWQRLTAAVSNAKDDPE